MIGNTNVRLVPWQLWTIMPAVRLCETVILQLLPLTVNENSLIFFELVVAKCFYLSRNLFPNTKQKIKRANSRGAGEKSSHKPELVRQSKHNKSKRNKTKKTKRV